MFFKRQLDVGVLAVLVRPRLLVGRRWMKVNNYFCTKEYKKQKVPNNGGGIIALALHQEDYKL